MRVIYDHEANVLRLITNTPAATAASLLDDPGIAVELATDDGHDIVGLMVMGASAYIPLGKCKSYDAASDTLLLGRMTTYPELITENGDFVGYWQPYEDEPDGFMDPVGVLLRNASKHLADISGLHDASAPTEASAPRR